MNLDPSGEKAIDWIPIEWILRAAEGERDAFVVRTAWRPPSKAKVSAHGFVAVVRGGMSSAEAKCGSHGGCGGSPCSQGERRRPWRMWWSEPVLTSQEATAMAAVVLRARAQKARGGGNGDGGGSGCRGGVGWHRFRLPPRRPLSPPLPSPTSVHACRRRPRHAGRSVRRLDVWTTFGSSSRGKDENHALI
jgi:hypothetical protein